MKIFIVTTVCLLVFACNQSPDVPPKIVHETPIAKAKKNPPPNNPFRTKTLKLLITNHLNAYFIYKGQELGLEYDLLKLYTQDRNWKLELEVVHEMDGMHDSLIANGANLAAASFGLPIFDDSSFIMSDYLYETQEVVVKRKETPSVLQVQIEVSVCVLKDAPFMQDLIAHHPKMDHLDFTMAAPHKTKQMLLEDVANGKLDYTLCSKNEFEIVKVFHPNLVIDEVLFPKFQIGFMFHPKNKRLLEDFNSWLAENRAKSDFQWTIYKYQKLATQAMETVKYKTLKEFDDEISNFDPLIKKTATNMDWDWRLLSALIFQESKFNPNCKSWVGALGLMQVMPNTAKQFGVRHTNELKNPERNLHAGSSYIQWMENHYFNDSLMKKEERVKFIIASYNVGIGHVTDAQKLAKKYGLNPNVWDDHVEKMILAKMEPKYYKDPVCKHGYCRGKETTTYVENIMNYFYHYAKYLDQEG